MTSLQRFVIVMVKEELLKQSAIKIRNNSIEVNILFFLIVSKGG